MLEAASKELRGGNSRFSGGIFRTTHDGLESLKPILGPQNDTWFGRVESAPYTADDYAADWNATSEGRQDAELMRITIERSFDTMTWMNRHGVQWELTGDKQVDPAKQAAGTLIKLPPGGAVRAYHEGVGLIENLFAAVEAAGIEVWYDAPAADLITNGSTIDGVRVRRVDEFVDVHGVVVLAAGGFESNPEMRLRYLGPGWDLVKVRGTAFNQGAMLTKAMLAGAQASGHWGGAHAAPIDAAAPAVGDLKMTDKYSRYSYPYALLVNRDGVRFMDEGEKQVWLTYAKTGWAIRAQPGAVAYQIFDQRTLHLLEPRYSTGTPVTAESIEELAGKLDLPAEGAPEDRRRLQRRRRSRRLGPLRAPRHRRGVGGAGGPAAQVELGAEHRAGTLHRLPGDLRHHVHLRRTPGRRRGARHLERGHRDARCVRDR